MTPGVEPRVQDTAEQSIPHQDARPLTLHGPRFAPLLLPLFLTALACAHGLLYTFVIPLWQTPDEPAQFEYAALVSLLGRVPAAEDRHLALEQQLADSLVRQRFFEYLVGHPPTRPLHTLDDAREQFFMPRQVNGDPPLYFILAALPIRLLAAQQIETQALMLRLAGVLFTAGAVACAYAAGRELLDDPRFALAVGLFVALQPMFTFISIGAGNDGLANLIGAACCWAVLRIVRLGVHMRRALLVALITAAGTLTKRTLLPLAALLLLLGMLWLIVRFFRAPGGLIRRLSVAVALGLGPALLLQYVFTNGYTPSRAADWVSVSEKLNAPRAISARGTGQPALKVRPGQVVMQALPDVAAEWAQNQDLQFSARVWAPDGAARGRLVIDFGWAVTEAPFAVRSAGQIVRVQTFVPLYCPHVHVVLQSEQGTIYADQLNAISARQPDINLLANGAVTRPALRPGSIMSRIARYLHLRELAWIWRSGRLWQPPPLGWDLVRIFFASFWGQFGWMSLPLVGASPWEGGLALICLGGLLGTLVWLVRPERTPPQRRAVVLLLCLIGSGLLFSLVNAYIQPRSQAIQQGRYLFPALVPIALVLALGWRAVTPYRWRNHALIGWAFFWLAFATAALQLVLHFYHPPI